MLFRLAFGAIKRFLGILLVHRECTESTQKIVGACKATPLVVSPGKRRATANGARQQTARDSKYRVFPRRFAIIDLLTNAMHSSGLHGGARSAHELEPGQSIGFEADPWRSPFYIVSRGSVVAELLEDQSASSHSGGAASGHSGGAAGDRAGLLVELGPSDLVLFPGGDAHRILVPKSSGRTARILVNEFRFHKPLVSGFFAELDKMIYLSAAEPGYAATIAPLTAMSCSEAGKSLPGAQAADKALLELYFVQILRYHITRLAERGVQCPRHPFALNFDPQLLPLLQKLHEKPEHPWTVEKMAAEVNMSRAAFSARFNQVAGKSPGAYLTNLRMELAANLLVDPSASVESVAAAVGYGSESAFSLAFKRHYGMAPGSWRRKVRSEST